MIGLAILESNGANLVGETGFLAGPPLIGVVADLTTLQISLFITVAAALIIAVYARMVKAADTY